MTGSASLTNRVGSLRLVDWRFKLHRVKTFGRRIGLPQALWYELQWSLRLKTMRVAVRGQRGLFQLRRNNSDIAVFEQVFVDREMDFDLPQPPSFIIDAGANIGLTTAAFARRYPDATVVAVEPSADNLALLRHNCRRLRNVEVIAGGLWHRPCHTRIANPDDPAWLFRLEECEPDAPGAVRAWTVGEIMAHFDRPRVSLLKIDIEGAERRLFAEGPGDWLSAVDHVLVEPHGDAALQAIIVAADQAGCAHRQVAEKVHLSHAPASA